MKKKEKSVHGDRCGWAEREGAGMAGWLAGLAGGMDQCMASIIIVAHIVIQLVTVFLK